MKFITGKVILFIFLFFNLLCFGACQDMPSSPGIATGVWVSIFSKDRVHYSKEAVVRLVDRCKSSNINQIYLQVYQSGNAYYDTSILPRGKYKDMLNAANGEDAIDFLLTRARENNIQVFAWVNLLSLGNNDKADILEKFGRDILTKDQFGRPSGRANPNDSDKYYLREDLLFLEPGDQKVARYLIAVVEEIIERYPLFSGVHLDYARYPMTVPFIPGSRFTGQGLSYGFGEKNIERFTEWTGLDPLKDLRSAKDYISWDGWRREQITSLVRRISKKVKDRSFGYMVSCAVVPSAERAYSSMFQDWPFWLEEGIIDYAVLMNYTLDNQLTRQLVRSALSYAGKARSL